MAGGQLEVIRRGFRRRIKASSFCYILSIHYCVYIYEQHQPTNMSQSNDNGNNSSHEQQDNSNSSSDFDDVYHRRIQEALKELYHPAADFYSKDKGKKKMTLRPRVEPPPTTDHASDSDLDVDPSKKLDSDDSCTDKHFQPLSSSSDSREDEFASSSKSPSKSPSKRRGASRQ